MATFHARPNVIANRHAPACFWAEAQVPYVPPGQGEQDQYVDCSAKSGDRVKIAQAFVGHYPTLCQVWSPGHGAWGCRAGHRRSLSCMQLDT